MMSSHIAALFFTICLAASAQAFQSSTSSTTCHQHVGATSFKNSHCIKTPTGRSSFILHNQNNPNEDEPTSFEEQTSNNQLPQPTEEELASKRQLARITGAIFTLFSYTIQFLGALFTFGLVLNLLGYGYRFDLDHGLEINKLENIRNEIQFEREILREEREDYLNGRSGGGVVREEVVIGNWGKSVLGK